MDVPIILDQDHIRQLCHDEKINDYTLRNNYHVSSVGKIFDLLSSRTSCVDTYILGVAGVGKSTYALEELNGYYTSSLRELYDAVYEHRRPIIAINAEVPRPELVQAAQEIHIIDAPQSQIYNQRKDRWLSDTFTNFGRSKHQTLGASVSIAIAKVICKKHAPDKTSIIYNDNNRSKQPLFIDTTIQSLYKNIVSTSGKFAPPHLWHTGMTDQMIKEQLPMRILLAGDLYKEWFTKKEKEKIFSQLYPSVDISYADSIHYNDEGYLELSNGQVIEIDYTNSIVYLGKERLPANFTQWSFTHPDITSFIKNEKHTITQPLKQSQQFWIFKRAKDLTDDDGHLSSSRYRLEMMRDNPDISSMKNRFHPVVRSIISRPDFCDSIRKRLLQIKEYNNILKREKAIIQSNHAQDYQIKYCDTYWSTDFVNTDWSSKKFNRAFLLKKPTSNYEENMSFIADYQYSLKQSISVLEKQIKQQFQFDPLPID